MIELVQVAAPAPRSVIGGFLFLSMCPLFRPNHNCEMQSVGDIGQFCAHLYFDLHVFQQFSSIDFQVSISDNF